MVVVVVVVVVVGPAPGRILIRPGAALSQSKGTANRIARRSDLSGDTLRPPASPHRGALPGARRLARACFLGGVDPTRRNIVCCPILSEGIHPATKKQRKNSNACSDRVIGFRSWPPPLRPRPERGRWRRPSSSGTPELSASFLNSFQTTLTPNPKKFYKRCSVTKP